MTFFIAQNEPEATRRIVPFWLVQSNGTSAATNEAGGRPQWSINGSAYTNAPNTLSAVSANAGRYFLQLNQSDTSIPGVIDYRYSSTTCFEQSGFGCPVQIIPNNVYNPQYVSQQSKLVGGTTSAVSLGSGETTRDDWFNGAGILFQHASGDLSMNIISDYTGASKSAQLQNVAPFALSSAVTYFIIPGAQAVPLGDVWNTPTSSYSTTGTFGAVLNWESGSAQSGRNSGISLATAAASVDNFYNNSIIRIVKGTGAGQSRIISDYTGATRSAEVNGAWATNPDSTSEYAISPLGAIPGASAPTANENAQAVWEYSSLRTVDSATTVRAFAGSAVSIGIAAGSYSGATIGGVLQLNSGVSLLGGRTYSDVSVRADSIGTIVGGYAGSAVSIQPAPGSYSATTIGGVVQLNSGVSLLGGKSYSDVSVVVTTIAPTGRTEIARSLLSLDVGNSRIMQEYLWPLRNKVQTDPAGSVGTVFKPDDTTSSWTFGFSTSTVAISGFDPNG